ncbi:MAG: glycolate oxidase iron-sulfur subunit [Chitinophagales bacterium]|jgi:glycolate oxidase iron-sulfur subunit
MQTNLSPRFKEGKSAETIESILRSCVHCGFCNATCPTYQLRGDELDGPRGRIYQMKQYFEGESANREIQLHLDRCLTCRSCETTCPSGVNYSRLLEIGREAIEHDLPRSASQRGLRWAITWFLNSGWIFKSAIRIAHNCRWLLPTDLSQSIPQAKPKIAEVIGQHERQVLMLSGCVQPALAPNTNAAAKQLLHRLGLSVIEIDQNTCCGAVGMHTSQIEQGKAQARRLIDAWWPKIESGVEAIVFTASGCGVSIKDYGTIFKDEIGYAEKGQAISDLALDLSQLVAREIKSQNITIDSPKRVAFHSPCTMQHGLGLKGLVETLLTNAGYHVCQVADPHLCCGSAGTYSILQPQISKQLQVDKQTALTVDSPEVIATANIGCQLQIGQGSKVPVVHWIELLNDAL